MRCFDDCCYFLNGDEFICVGMLVIHQLWYQSFGCGVDFELKFA